MNIWIFNHYAVGPDSSGGTRHYDLAKQLVKKGHSVTIFASSYNHQLLKEEQFTDGRASFKECDYNQVKFVWIKTIPYNKNDLKRVLNMVSYSIRSLLFAFKKKEKPDIVIGSLVHPLAAFVGYLVARKCKSLFYFEERDLWPQTLIDLGKMPEKHPLINILGKIELFLFRKADRIIVLFDKAIGYVTSKGIEQEKVIYLPNGFDLDRTNSKKRLPPSLEDLFCQLSGQLIAIYTGAHGLANNLDAVLNTALELQKKNVAVHFVLIGDGPEKQRLKERSLNEAINNVTFIDPVKKELIPFILERSDIGLLPLKNSPVFKWGISPNKMFDYMGASLPVILLCDIDDSPVELANGGRVIKSDYEESMVKFFSHVNRKELELLGRNAREYVEIHHSWDKLSTKLIKIMEEDILDAPTEKITMRMKRKKHEANI